MFSLFSGSAVKRLADSGSLTSRKDQEQIHKDFLPLLVWDGPYHQHVCCALCAHHRQEIPE